MSDMSGKFTEATDVEISAAAPAPITQESPYLLKAGDSIRSILESLVVKPAAGGDPGTLSLGEGKARISTEANKATLIYNVPVAALSSISPGVIETALNTELKNHDFFSENYDLTKDMAWRGNYVKDTAKLITEITSDPAVTIAPEVKERLQAWADRQGKENAGTGYFVSQLRSGEEDLHNRVIFPIEANGTSPKDKLIAAKDFVTANLQGRKEDILKAVIAAANEADAKHMAEQGTPLFTPEEIARLNPETIGKVGGLDLAIEDSARGQSGRVELVFGTRKELAENCKDLPRDQLEATPLSKLSDEVRREIISTAVRTAGANAEEIYSIVAGGDVALKELHDALGGKESSYHDRIEILRKAAKEAKLDWREQDANREKNPHITVNLPYGDNTKDSIEVVIPAPDGMSTDVLLAGISADRKVVGEPDKLTAFIGQAAAGKKHHELEDEPKGPGDDEPGEEPKAKGEDYARTELAVGSAPKNGKGPVSVETPVGIDEPKIQEPKIQPPTSGPGTAPKDKPDAVVTQLAAAEHISPKVPGRNYSAPAV